METARALLGIAGDFTDEQAGVSHYATKVGGLPRFPGAQAPPGCSHAACLVCSRPLSLVFQVGQSCTPHARRM